MKNSLYEGQAKGQENPSAGLGGKERDIRNVVVTPSQAYKNL